MALILPERFADGAAMGIPQSLIKSNAIASSRSAEEHLVSIDYHLGELLIIEEEDMRSSSNHAIQVAFFDIEMHV